MYALRSFLFSLATAALITQSAAAAGPRTYYVGAGGNDAASGLSPQQAWKTIGRVNRGTFLGGERLLFEGGKSFSGTLRFDATILRGTADAPVTIGSYGIGRAIIDSGDEEALVASRVAGLRITNLVFRGSSLLDAVFSRNGLEFSSDQSKLPGITIDHTEVTGFSLAGIVFEGVDRHSGFASISIDRVSVHDCGYNAISTLSGDTGTFSDVSITNSEIANIPGYKTAYGQLVEGAGSGLALEGLIFATIDGNVIHDCGETGGGPSGIALSLSDVVTISHNEVHHIHTATDAVSGGGINLSASVLESFVAYNYTHDNDGPGIALCACGDTHITVRDDRIGFNISENDGRTHRSPAFVFFGGQPTSGLTFFNNTIFLDRSFDGAGSAIALNGNGATYPGLRFSNNLVITDHGVAAVEVTDPTNATDLRFDTNAYYTLDAQLMFRWNGCSYCEPQSSGTVYTTADSWSTATGQERTGGTLTAITVDPFVSSTGNGGTLAPRRLPDLSAYRLLPTSPLVDHGLNLPEDGIDVGDHDFFGYPLGLGVEPDIGANEEGGFPAPPTIAAIANQTVILGEPLSVDIDALDPDGTDALRLELISPPAGVTLTALGHGRGIITIAPSAPASPLHVTVQVFDDGNRSANTGFDVTVVSPPERMRAIRH